MLRAFDTLIQGIALAQKQSVINLLKKSGELSGNDVSIYGSRQGHYGPMSYLILLGFPSDLTGLCQNQELFCINKI